ncbi:DNA/RNA polymerases superfamily protein [Gossypium australe]|uniref:DNA/RNA polymerases superfamily protein n=1 Tax=Gossypium australe TaxID=47621 RepID=A0A5B6VKN8_9ROSI|nr:DNA/RNA polymerases superfamily protein [Gossypium australe]
MFTDQKSLKYLMTQKELNLATKVGKANVVADALSRKSLFALRAMNTRMALLDDGLDHYFFKRFVKHRKRTATYKPKEFYVNPDGCLTFRDRVCVSKNDELIQKILSEAHSGCLTIHPGSTEMYNDLRKWYWWPSMKKDISEFVSKCLICQHVKAEHQVPLGLVQPIMVSEWEWDRIIMDFVTGLPLTPKKKDAVWVVVDRLTKSAHFIPLVELYVSEIVRLHGVPLPIILDRDPRFTSRFWTKLQEALGTKLSFSTTFHPQTDGQSKRVIQILEDMLRCCVLEFQGNWEKYLPLVEFTYNNGF